MCHSFKETNIYNIRDLKKVCGKENIRLKKGLNCSVGHNCSHI